jgi:hypothetical protein
VEGFEIPRGVAVVLAIIVCGAIVAGAIAHFLEPIVVLLQGIREWWAERGD